MDEVIEIKQKFDQAVMWVLNECDGEIMIHIRLIVPEEKPSESNAVIWLDSDQRKDLIEILKRME